MSGNYLICSFVLLFFMISCANKNQANLSTPQIASESKENIRNSVLAGTWYEGKKEDLEKQVDTYLKNAKPENLKLPPKGLIVPHAGYEYSGQIAAYGYKTLEKTAFKRVIILGTCHHTYLKGLSISDYTHYRTPLGDVPVDRKVCDELLKEDLFTYNPDADNKEHSIEIQLPFLQRISKDFKIIPVIVGDLREEDYKKVASILNRYVDSETIVIASSDMTHYGNNFGYVPFKKDIKNNLEKLDKGAIDKILKLDVHGFLSYISDTEDTICGYSPVCLLMSMMDKGAVPELLKYSTSGEITGDYSNSVSYASIVFMQENNGSNETGNLTKEEEETLLHLSRKTLEMYIKDGKKPEVEKFNITDTLKEERGVFVTLTKDGILRGCIGFIEGIEPLYKAVIDNTINASTEDPRFPPVSYNEINDIKIEISVMSPLKKIDNISEIIVGIHGLIIEKGYYRGVLLPQVATEYGWDRDTFLDEVSMKAGLNSKAWKDKDAKIYIFSAQIFHEK